MVQTLGPSPTSEWEKPPAKSALWTGPALTLAYLVSGKLALALALPPGYASAIFPPAGIAVAACFIAGAGRLPWVFLGALLLNIWVGVEAGRSPTLLGLGSALAIAFASTTQAWIGGILLRRVAGYPQPFDQAGKIVKFLLCAPVLCMVSAFLSVSLLTLIGTFALADMTVNLLTWWVGDILGVLVILPPAVAYFGEPRELWRGRRAVVALPMAIALGLFVFLFILTAHWERGNSLADFRNQAQNAADQLQTRLEQQEIAAQSIAILLSQAGNAPIAQDDFKRIAVQFLQHFPAVQGFAWAPRVDFAARAAFEAQLGVEIHGASPQGEAKRSSEADHYYPVVQVEPDADGFPVLGVDALADTSLASVIARAEALDRPVASEPRHLLARAGQPLGLSLVVIARDSARIRGLVVAGLDIAELVGRQLPQFTALGQVRLFDPVAGIALYDTIGKDGAAIYSRELRYGMRTYRFDCDPTPAYLAEHRGWQSWSVLSAGLFGTGLLGALLMLGSGHTAQVKRQVAETVGELTENDEKLRGLYQLSPLGIALTDIDGRFIEFNEAFRRICGYAPEELILLDYWTLTPRQYAADEAVQLESLARTGRYGPYVKEYRRKDGTLVPVSLNGMLIAGKRGEQYIWSIVEDITQRKLAEEQMQISDAVFETTSDAIMVVDLRGRIVTINPAFERITGYTRAEVLGKTPSILKSGRHDENFYRAMWKSILADGRWEGEIWNRRKSGETYPQWMNIHTILGRDGQPVRRYCVFADITERKQAEEQVNHLAYHDLLTNLPNRSLYYDRLQQVMAAARREKTRFALLYVDLDNFKPVNDTFGHLAGDQLLRETAGRMVETVRESDTVARIGGDEFVVLLATLKSTGDALGVAEKIRRALEIPFDIDGHQVLISCSIGGAIYPEDGTEDVALAERADRAMYAAKNGGRNQVRFAGDYRAAS